MSELLGIVLERAEVLLESRCLLKQELELHLARFDLFAGPANMFTLAYMPENVRVYAWNWVRA